MLASQDMDGRLMPTPVGQADLEQRVIDTLLAQADSEPFGQALRQQLSSRDDRSRQLSGVGFFLEFDVARDCPPIENATSPLHLDAYGSMDDHDFLAGFILFAEKPGYASMLEGFTYAGVWPDDASTINVTEHLPEGRLQ